MSESLVTVIVVTHNSARWRPRMLAALAAQTEERWRLVLIDNGSRADERPGAGDLPANAILIQSQDNLGFAEANNRAARDAETPFLVFLNPDAFPEPNWLAELLALAVHYPEAATIGSTQIRADADNIFDGTGDVLHASGIAYRSNYGRPRVATPPLGETFAACAAAMLVRREAFEAVEGFDARYFCYFEDVDLCFRLRLAGWRILQSANAIVHHVGGGVAGARSDFGDFHGARNRTWTFFKCMPGALVWLLAPLHLAACAATSTSALIRVRSLSPWRGFLTGLFTLGPMLKTRRALQRARRASVGDIARMLAWNPLVMLDRKPVIRQLSASPPSAAPIHQPDQP